MADINGIIGYNSPDGNNFLLAAYGNDIVDVSTGLGFKQNISSGHKAFFEVFIDRVFFCNGYNKMISMNSQGQWSDSIALPKQLIPKYIKKSVNNAQLLIGNVQLVYGSGSTINYRSHVFKSNLPKLGKSASGGILNQTLEWGIESGQCVIYQDTKKVKAVPDVNGKLPYFKTRGIRVGDPFFLLGGDIGQYTVASVDSEYELTLNESIPSSTSVNTNVNFWVGRNFFPVGTDDNDEITGFGENSSRDLIFKLFSLWQYIRTELKQVKGAVGTNSQRSVINDRNGNTYYFHGSSLKLSGIYRFDGVSSKKISRAIDPYIQGMNPANYEEVVAWEEGDELRWYLGDITNTSYDIYMEKAVATLNTSTGAWDVTPIYDAIKCSTKWIQSNAQHSYCGTDSDQILKMGVGYKYKNNTISSVVETGVYYPAGSELICRIPEVQMIGRNINGLKLSYKRWNKPFDTDDRWISLGECRQDKNEFPLTVDFNFTSGLQFRIEDTDTGKNNWLVEKISFFYKPERSRLL